MANEQEIMPGMKVEATEGDLGEQDMSPARVTEVIRDDRGEVEAIALTKGVLFRKTLEVPVERIETVETAAGEEGALS